MATDAPARCPSCRAALPADAPGGLCPRCLLRDGLDSDALSLSRAGELGATVDLAGPPSVLDTLSAAVGPVPRVLLRDTDPGTEPPVHRPGSPELPAPEDRPARLRLLGEIARGGMGAVLKGRDEDLGRDLAIKILLEKHRGNPDLIRRFIEEAQIGGQLQHPGIVPIYELGAFADRRPYFAMKLVKGQTLAALLAGRKDPADGLPRFLAIFEQVCQTVAYAHARGVIHRDLKPSNVMVGGFGEVQVMDWGLAKVLPRGGAADDASAGRQAGPEAVVATARGDSDRSRAGSVMGTPSYMAPEQARGEVGRVDERADVFALGSMLCEILTGSPAFAGRSSSEILGKASRGDVADALARLESRVAEAELVGLARDCLAVEPGDRPRDARVVADRVTAYLVGVQERLHASLRERAVAEARAVEERRKRHWQLGLAATIVASLLIGGVGLAAFAAILDRKNDELSKSNADLKTQRLRAEDRERLAIDAVRRFRDAVAENPALRDNPELEALRKALLKEPLGFFRDLRDRLQADGDTRPEALARLATATYELGYLTDEIGDKRDAITAHRAALSIFARLADVHPTSTEYRRDLARSYNSLGILLAATGQPAEARAAFEETRAIQQRLADTHPDVADYRRTLAVTHNNLGNLLRVTGQPAEARTAYDASLAIRRALADAHPDVADYHLDLAVSHHNLGVLLSATGERAAARASHESARAILRRLVEAHPTVTEHQMALARGHGSLGVLLRSLGEPAEARTAMEAALAIWQRLSDAQPQTSDYASQRGGTLNNLARLDLDAYEFAAAANRLREAIAWQKKALATNPLHPTYREFLQQHYTNLLRAARGLADADLEAEARSGLAELEASDPRLTALDARLATVLRGEAPKDNAERLALAQRAYESRHYAAAARLWAEALESDPTLAESRQAQYPYNAACAAALGAAGTGRDDPMPDDAARAGLRDLALGWLRAELAAWSAALDSDDPQARAAVATSLRHWRQDPDLASVRDPDSLAALPEPERGDWQAVWAEVDRMLEEAGEAP